MTRIRSSCLCGGVVWTVEPPLEHLHHCHCQRCRKSHGTAFATYAIIPAVSFRYAEGADGVVRFASSPGYTRAFCGRCGSVVADGADLGGGHGGMPMGTLDADTAERPQMHIFVGSKAPWYRIDDALPQFDTFPSGDGLDGAPPPVQPDLTSPAPSGQGLRGSCLCGGVAFVAPGAPVRSLHCHCGRCRKARAAAHASNYVTTDDGVRFTQGEELLASYKVPEATYFTQVFCARCGSKMPRVDPSRKIAMIPLGSLDDPPPITPQGHIFADWKAAWFEIPADGLPRYAEGPPR